jgi:hypothetical protein
VNIEEAELLRKLGGLRREDLPELATQALVDGRDSPSLSRARGVLLLVLVAQAALSLFYLRSLAVATYSDAQSSVSTEEVAHDQ